MDENNKSDLLKDLKEKMVSDTALPLRESNLVFGEGDINCDIMFIGEAPGFHEDRLGRPFVGRAGELLTKSLVKIGWKRGDVYITNIIKRRPPENRDPLPEEIQAYTPYLTDQISIINPKIIVPLGRFSMNYFLPDAKITRDQGKIFYKDNRMVIPMLHPAAALRSTAVLVEFTKSFAALPYVVKNYKDGVQRETKEPEKRPDISDMQQPLFSL